MRFIDTAFQQLAFAWKLYNYAAEGKIDLAALDKPLTFAEGQSMLVVPDQIFSSESDLVLACENQLVVAFGAASITLHRCSEEAGARLPDPIVTECDQYLSLVYQIRNAFAHDIAEPRWEMRNRRYARPYEVDGVRCDLTDMSGQQFHYSHIGGVESLFMLKAYGESIAWGRAP